MVITEYISNVSKLWTYIIGYTHMTYIENPEDVLGVFWMSYVYLTYVLYPGGRGYLKTK